jgi:hypothetical protein
MGTPTELSTQGTGRLVAARLRITDANPGTIEDEMAFAIWEIFDVSRAIA